MNPVHAINFTGRISFWGNGTQDDAIELTGGQKNSLYPLILRHLRLTEGYVLVYGKTVFVKVDSSTRLWASEDKEVEAILNSGLYDLPARTTDAN